VVLQGGGALPSPATLISNNRIYGALNPAGLASTINIASNGNALARIAMRESVRNLITVVENAQLDSALQNLSAGASPPPASPAPVPAPSPAAITPSAQPASAAIPYTAPRNTAATNAATGITLPNIGTLTFPPEWAPIAEKKAFYSSPKYYAFRSLQVQSTAPTAGGDSTFDNYTLNAINSYSSNYNILGFMSSSQMNQATRMNDLRKVQQQAAALGYHMTLDDILTMANGRSVSFTRSASNPETRVSTSLQAPDGSAVLTVTANRAVTNGPSAALLGALGSIGSIGALQVVPDLTVLIPAELKDSDNDGTPDSEDPAPNDSTISGDLVVVANGTPRDAAIARHYASQYVGERLLITGLAAGAAGLELSAALRALGWSTRQIAAAEGGMTAMGIPNSPLEALADMHEQMTDAVARSIIPYIRDNPDEFYSWLRNPITGEYFDANSPGYNQLD
jgi:hypothetical protein